MKKSVQELQKILELIESENSSNLKIASLIWQSDEELQESVFQYFQADFGKKKINNWLSSKNIDLVQHALELLDGL